MTPTQSRMARAALGMTVDQAGEASGVGRMSIVRYENRANVDPEKVRKIRNAYEANGVQFFYCHGGHIVEGVIPPK